MADTENLQLPDPQPSTDANAEALLSIAKDDDSDAYVKFREAQIPEDNGEKPETDDRLSRVEQALEEARARTREAREQTDSLDREYAQAEHEYQQQQAAEGRVTASPRTFVLRSSRKMHGARGTAA